MNRATLLIISVVVVAGLVVLAGLFVRARLRQSSYPTASAMPAVANETIQEVLARLESTLAELAPDTLAALQPGLSANEIAALESQHGIRLSDELRALYMWRNGTAADNPTDFFPRHRFPALEWVIEQKAAEAGQIQAATAVQRAAHSLFAGYRQSWLTLFDDGAGDGYFYDPERPQEQGSVFYHFTEDGYYLFFPSLRNLLAGVVECYSQDVYYVDANGRLAENFDRTHEVWRTFGGPGTAN